MKLLCSRSFIKWYFAKNFHVSKVIQNLTLNASKSTKNSHCYKNLYPWKTLSDFSEYLSSCIVYNKHGVIALNKPYGIKIKKDQAEASDTTSKNVRYAALLAPETDFPYSVEEALPYLCNHLESPNLSILKSTERYSSGLVLMSTNNNTSKKVEKSFNIAKNQKRTHLVYWAVTRGYPICSMRQEKVGMKFVDIEFKNEKQPVIVTDYSHNDVKQKRIKTFLVDYRVLNVDKTLSTSLLEIAVSATSGHFLRVYASSRAASILGDQFYGSRMQSVLGVPVKINPHNMVAFDSQPLPKPICERLNLPANVEGHLLVPTMLHLQAIILPKFQKEEDVVITASPPLHFQWTCAQLNLHPAVT